jgi:hypothetical protein
VLGDLHKGKSDATDDSGLVDGEDAKARVDG